MTREDCVQERAAAWAERELAAAYRRLLAGHLASASGEALGLAAELGRTARAAGLSPQLLLAVHQEALAAALPPEEARLPRLLERAHRLLLAAVGAACGREEGAGLPPSGVVRAGAVRHRVLAADLLTPRERQVLQLVGEGKSTKLVAAILGISVKTADSHRSRLMSKLDIHETATLVRYAIRRGLVQP